MFMYEDMLFAKFNNWLFIAIVLKPEEIMTNDNKCIYKYIKN